MVKTTLLDQEYELKLTMGAVANFTASTDLQVEWVFDLMKKIHDEAYQPTGADQLNLGIFVYSCYLSAVNLKKGTPIGMDDFMNSVSPTEVYTAFVNIVTSEYERRASKKESTPKDM